MTSFSYYILRHTTTTTITQCNTVGVIFKATVDDDDKVFFVAKEELWSKQRACIGFHRHLLELFYAAMLFCFKKNLHASL